MRKCSPDLDESVSHNLEAGIGVLRLWAFGRPLGSPQPQPWASLLWTDATPWSPTRIVDKCGYIRYSLTLASTL